MKKSQNPSTIAQRLAELEREKNKLNNDADELRQEELKIAITKRDAGFAMPREFIQNFFNFQRFGELKTTVSNMDHTTKCIFYKSFIYYISNDAFHPEIRTVLDESLKTTQDKSHLIKRIQSEQSLKLLEIMETNGSAKDIGSLFCAIMHSTYNSFMQQITPFATANIIEFKNGGISIDLTREKARLMLQTILEDFQEIEKSALHVEPR